MECKVYLGLEGFEMKCDVFSCLGSVLSVQICSISICTFLSISLFLYVFPSSLDVPAIVS